MESSEDKIGYTNFYRTWSGHEIYHLRKVLKNFRELLPNKHYIYLAGDSSLDNKAWIEQTTGAVNGYQQILEPKLMKKDISYHLNKVLATNKMDYICINTSIEETTLGIRDGGDNLLPQDQFIQENIQRDDILIVSVGGNDIALAPTSSTIFNMLLLQYCNSTDSIKKDIKSSWGAGHFLRMFKDDLENYVTSLVAKNKPKKVIICMIYYPDQSQTGSWADTSLGLLGYNSNPEKLKVSIEQVFVHAISEIKIEGTEVISFPMFKILDGTHTEDYVQRVEPSDIGGQKLAEAFFDVIKQ